MKQQAEKWSATALGGLRFLFSRPRFVAMILLSGVTYWWIVGWREVRMKRDDPEAWKILYSRMGGTTTIRCVIAAVVGMLIVFLPLYSASIVLYRRARKRPEKTNLVS